MLPARTEAAHAAGERLRVRPMSELLRTIGLVAGVVMPLWNIPLILKIRRRQSSKDISLPWALGVFGCIVLMLPAALVSPDMVFRAFAISNVVLFGFVVAQVLRYRHG